MCQPLGQGVQATHSFPPCAARTCSLVSPELMINNSEGVRGGAHLARAGIVVHGCGEMADVALPVGVTSVGVASTLR